MRKSTALVFIFSVLALLPVAAKAETFLNLSVSAPGGVWKNEQTNIPVYCKFVNVTGNATGSITGETKTVFYGEILDSSGKRVATLPERLDQMSYSYAFPNLETGLYGVTIKCKGNITENNTTTQMENSSSFQVKVRLVSIGLIGVSPSSPYSDSNITLYVNLTETVQSGRQLTGNDIGSDKWAVYYGSENIGSTPIYNYNYDRWEIPLNRNLNSGSQDIRVVVNYEGKGISLTKSLYVSPSYEFYIFSVQPENLVKDNDVTVTLHATYHNSSIIEKIIGYVSLKLGDETVSYTKTSDNKLVFKAPDFSPGSYSLKAVIYHTEDVDGDGKTERITGEPTKTVEYLVPLHGEVTDALGKSLSGTIQLTNKDGFTKNVYIRNGVYSDSVSKGTYTLRLLNLPYLDSAVFTEVEVTGEMSDIFKYDSFSDVSIPGIKTVSAIALEFMPGFKGLTLKIIYDASKVSDETAIKVYKCSNWNIDARSCGSAWEQISAELDTFSNTVTIETTSLSAFLVGETIGLTIEGKLDKKEYYAGEEAQLTGVVKDVDGKPVKDAVVKYQFDTVTGEAGVNSEGIFSKKFKVPEREGTYNLTLSLPKSLYKKTSVGIEFSVKKKKELTFIVPINAEASEGKETTLDISILNSGQTVLQNIQITISGMPDGWYDFTPKVLKELTSGGEGRVSLKITVPHNVTENSYIVNVKANNSEIEKSDNFVLFLKGKKQEETNNTAVQGPVFVLDFDPITAYLSANQASLINAVSVVVAVVIIFSLFIRTKGRGLATQRESIINLLQSIKQEVLKGGEKDIRKSAKVKGSRKK